MSHHIPTPTIGNHQNDGKKVMLFKQLSVADQKSQPSIPPRPVGGPTCICPFGATGTKLACPGAILAKFKVCCPGFNCASGGFFGANLDPK